MKNIFTVFITIALGFLVGYQTERPMRIITKEIPVVRETATPSLPESKPFFAKKGSVMTANAISAETNHIIPKGYGMYADFDRVLSIMLQWPEKKEATYLYLGVGSTEESVQRRPWGDIYSGYVTGKTGITIALPQEWDNQNVFERTVYVRLWEKIGNRWKPEDFAFDISDSTRLCTDVVELACGILQEGDALREKTFLNMCELKKAGATLLHLGMCGGGGGEECTAEYAPVCGQRYPAGCEAYILETNDNSGFEIPPKCQPIRETFSNACEMRRAGAEFLYEGECKKGYTDLQKKAQYMCENADTLGLSPYIPTIDDVLNSYGEVLDCRDGYVKVLPPPVLPDAPSILFDEYFNRVASCGGYRPEGSRDPEICAIECRSAGVFLCGGGGDPQIECTEEYDPVCAVTKNDVVRTFPNACYADKAQAIIIHTGMCRKNEVGKRKKETNIPKECVSWYDGCNTCSVKDGVLGVCTTRYCLQQEQPRCIEWEDGYKERKKKEECEKKDEPVCGVDVYGKLKNYKNSCEMHHDKAEFFSKGRCDKKYRARLFEMSDGKDTFVLKIDDPETILQARKILNKTERTFRHISGKIIPAPAEKYDNGKWHFRIDPQTVFFFDEGKPECNASIADVEEAVVAEKELLPDNRWCPFGSYLVREIPGEYAIE